MRILILLCLVIVQSNVMALPEVPREKYDAAYSVCQAVVPTTHRDFSLANKLVPAAVWPDYFVSRNLPFEISAPINLSLIEGPIHGVLRQESNGGYVYYPNEGYLGPDQLTWVVEAQGKKFKVIETVWVANTAPEYGGCPDDYKLPPAK